MKKSSTGGSIMNLKRAFILVVFTAVALMAFGFQNTLEHKVLFEKAKFTMETKGDLKEAINLFNELIKKYPKEREYAAKSQLYIGLCYEKLGLKQAQKAYQQVIDGYPEQTEAVRIAKEKLNLILKAKAVIERGRKEFKITKIHTEKSREGYFSPDGKKLALADYGNLWIRDISSDKEVHLVDDSSLILDLFWSPDSKTIAYVNLAWNVNVVSVKGGPSKTIIKIDPESEKAGNFIYPSGWTADGKKLVFRDSSKGLFAIPRDGGNWEEIYRFSSAEEAKKRINENMALSPDGKLVAYDSKKNNNTDIYIMPIGSKKSIRVTFDSANDTWPRWSYDGKWLAFSSKRSGDSRIWVVRISSDGKPAGKPIQVTREEADNGAWTHDGNISFMTSESTVHIFSANMDGSEEIQLTKLRGATYPRWSPDGKKIAFVRWDRLTGNKAIWTIPSKGGEEKRLTIGEFPVWSPDGKLIAYNAQPRRFPFKTVLSIIPAEGGKPRELMNYDGFLRNLDWSPDGKYIAFSYSGGKDIKNPIPDSRLDIEDIYIIPAKGGEPQRVTQMDKKGYQFTSSRWSPDGKKIAFRSLDYGTLSKGGKVEPIGIWTIDSDGRNPKLIAQELDGWEIAWSNDGKYIIGSKHIEESEESWLAGHKLFRITVKSGKLEELNVKGQMVDTSPDGEKVVYSRFAGFEKSFWLAENFLPKKK
jgi:Tol biopolymer transport system component